MIPPGIGTRLYRHEPVTSLVVGEASPCPREVRVERSRVLVQMVRVASCGVGLPDLDETVTHGASVTIEHTSRNDYPLPQRFVPVLTGQVVIRFFYQATSEGRPCCVREGLGKDDERLLRRPETRRHVVRVQVRRVGIVAPVTGGVSWRFVCHALLLLLSLEPASRRQ